MYVTRFESVFLINYPSVVFAGSYSLNSLVQTQCQPQQIQQLKETLHRYGRGHIVDTAIEKKDLLDTTLDLVTTSLPDLVADKYDLVANITHDSPADVGREGITDPLQEGSYKCHVQHRGTKQWYEIQDLHVQEIMPQQISVSESYLLIFERKSARLDSK